MDARKDGGDEVSRCGCSSEAFCSFSVLFLVGAWVYDVCLWGAIAVIVYSRWDVYCSV